MSFYGQVIQEFTRLFSKFTVKTNNTNETAIVPPESTTSFSYEADTMWDTLKVEPINRWIQMRDASSGDAHILSVGHGTPGTKADDGFIVSNSVPQAGEPATAVEFTQLKNGDYLTVAAEFDNAGHLNATNKSYYRLPIATINIGTMLNSDDEEIPVDITPDSENDKLLLRGDNHWITLGKNIDTGTLTFSHDIKTTAELTPQLRVNSEAKQWEVSYDNGATWTLVTDAPSEDAEGNSTSQPWDKITLDYNSLNTFTHLSNTHLTKTMAQLAEEIAAADVSPYPESVTEIVNKAENADLKVIPLESGELIKTYKIDKDERGHVIGTSEVYLQMPVTASEVDFTTHEAHITALENRLNGIQTTTDPETGEPITTKVDTYEENVDKLNFQQEFLYEGFDEENDIWVPEDLKALTGTLQDMYSEIEKEDPEDPESKDVLVNANKTLASTIGKMDGEDSIQSALKDLLEVNTLDQKTLSEAIQLIIEKYLAYKNEVNNKINTYDLALSGLTARVQALENAMS